MDTILYMQTVGAVPCFECISPVETVVDNSARMYPISPARLICTVWNLGDSYIYV